ncbi:hypothetical protein [Brevibacillus brevis]|uniref:Uncharacterized protein n=1 Tax=Brevibacillus brevis TaxID=1393 RepID=A0ABY9T5Y8_BREBE|nr:hypothetical protein [Brevibacillus brevis]WNC14894.1 hypothetical protein RGB73_00390 [Brevibacillus brevis]
MELVLFAGMLIYDLASITLGTFSPRVAFLFVALIFLVRVLEGFMRKSSLMSLAIFIAGLVILFTSD